MIVVYPKWAARISQDTYTYKNVQTCTLKNNFTAPFNITSPSLRDDQLTVLDYRVPLFVQAGILIVASIFFVIFFKCSYLRLKAEKEKRDIEATAIATTTQLPNLS
jgi:hypothetical protein